MPTLAEVRQKFPQYSDLSDAQLVNGLHSKFYSDMPQDQFYSKVGYKPFAPPLDSPAPFYPDEPAPPVEPKAPLLSGDLAPLAPAAETLTNVGRVYPVLEALANIGSQVYALPTAGMAGLGTMAANALGVDEAAKAGNPVAKLLAGNPADSVNSVASALTVQPFTEHGREMTDAVAYPFHKLAEAGNAVGETIADQTQAAAQAGNPNAQGPVGPALGAIANALTQVGLPSALHGLVRQPAPAPELPARDPSRAQPGLQELMPAEPRPAAAAPLREGSIIDATKGLLPQLPPEADRPRGTQWEAANGPAPNAGPKAWPFPQDFEAPNGMPPMPDRPQLWPPPSRPEATTGRELVPQTGEPPKAIKGPAPSDEALTGAFSRENLPALNAQVNDAIERWNNGTIKSGAIINVGRPSDVLQRFGVPDLPIQLTQRVLKKAIRSKHTLAVSDLRDLAASIHAPIAVFASKKGPSHRILVTEARHADGNVVVALEMETIRNRVEINDITSIHPRKDESVANWLSEGRLLGYESTKGRKWLEAAAGSNSLRDQATPTFDGRIVYDASHLHNLGEGGKSERDVTPANSQSLPPDSLPQSPMPAEPARGVSGFEVPAPETAADEPSVLESRGGQADKPEAWNPGVNYSGMVDDLAPRPARPAPGGGVLSRLFPSLKSNRPITRESILRPFLKAMGARVYEGRIKSKKALGLYMRKRGWVRVKKHADLEVTAHEIAHHIDDWTFNGFGTAPGKPNTRPWLSGPKAAIYTKELKGVSYDHDKVHEGFAEFVRHWMTQPDVVKRVAPEFYAWWENFVATDPIGPALREAQAGMLDWFDQSNRDKLASKIGDNGKINADLDSILDEARQAIFDDLHGIYRMEQQLHDKPADGGAYVTARVSRGAHSVVEGAMTMGVPKVMADGSTKFVGQSLQAILKPVADHLDDFGLYAVARSARELFAQGRENLLTRAEIQAGLALETPEFKKAFEEYQGWNKGIVDFAQAKGIINPTTRKLWQRTEYLPFYRVGQKGQTKAAGGMPGHLSPVKRLRGGTANLQRPLHNMIQNASYLIAESMKNEARAEIAKIADNAAGGGRYLVRIKEDTRAVDISKDQIKKLVAEMLGIPPSQLDGGGLMSYPPEWAPVIDKLSDELRAQPDYLKFWLFKQSPKGDNLMAVMRSGKPSFYEVADPILFRSIEALNRPAKHWVIEWMNVPRRVMQTTVTLTPDFIARNALRDSAMGWIMSRAGFVPIKDSIAGMRSRLAKDEHYAEFIANGGGFSSMLVNEEAFAKHLERFYTQRGISMKTIIDTPAKMLHALEVLANSVEMSTRLGEFKRLREKGVNPRQAAYLSREISTDFAMRGDSGVAGFLYDTVPFLKAAMNSMDRLYRGVAHDENRAAIAAKVGLLALASMALYAINRGNPLYEQLEDWDRDSHWHIYVPTDARDDAPDAEKYVHFRMPKLWEIGGVASIAERSLQHMMDGELKGFGPEVGKIVTSLFGVDVVPQAFGPVLENMMNRNRFTNRPIETPGMEDLQPWNRVAPYTSRTLAALGESTRNLPEALQLNPVRTEALLRGYFTTWAQYGLALADGALFDDKPDMRLDEYPVIRSFYAQEPAKHTKYGTEFYDFLGEATKLRRTVRSLYQGGRTDLASELEAKDDGTYGILNSTNRALQAVNREMRETIKNPQLNGAEKRERLDRLTAERNDLMKSAVTEAKQMKREATR